MAGKKILVIDDDPGVIRLNQSLLKTKGYEVISATNGLDGVQRAKDEQPDAILLDLILPEMHGFEVCRDLKANERTKDIPIVIVTASGLEEVAENEDDIPADGYLSKPYGIDKLDEALNKVLPQDNSNN